MIRPVIFVGYDERQIPPIPLFVLPRSPVVAGNGRSEPITSLRPIPTMES